MPAFRTVEDIEAHCERLGAVAIGGYRAVDGPRACVEISEVAAARLAAEARQAGRRARD